MNLALCEGLSYRDSNTLTNPYQNVLSFDHNENVFGWHHYPPSVRRVISKWKSNYRYPTDWIPQAIELPVGRASLRTVKSNVSSSISANRRPMQVRGPNPKGMYAKGCASLADGNSVLPRNHLSGMYSCERENCVGIFVIREWQAMTSNWRHRNGNHWERDFIDAACFETRIPINLWILCTSEFSVNHNTEIYR